MVAIREGEPMKCPYCDGTGECEATFGARLRALRNDKGLTQEEMSRMIGLSRPQIANLEANRSDPSMDTLRALMTKFDVSADWLLGAATPTNTETEAPDDL